MHDPNRITLTRPNGVRDHFVVCADCARQGKGSTVTTSEGVYDGVIYGPISLQLAAALLEEHRAGTDTPASGHH